MMKPVTRRQFIGTTTLSLLGAAVMTSGGRRVFAAPATTPLQPVRFAVISDPHVDIRGVNKMKMSAHSIECLQHTVDDLNREEELAFVMVNGDLLQDGELENARVVRDALSVLKAPVFVISGNHDYRPANPKKLRQGFTYLSDGEFRKYFAGFGYDDSARRYYARQIVPGLRLIALDACLPAEEKKWGGRLPDEQLHWLDQELFSHSDQVNLVFMHHNFLPWSVDELRGGPKQWFCIDNAAEVRSVLEKNVQATPIAFSGHRHIGLHTRELNSVQYFALPSLNSHPMRYSIFTVTHEQLSWKTPMVGVSEATHLAARQALLQASWWRDQQYRESSPANDMAVLGFYENNDMIVGGRKLTRV
ncbi:metallophosphoesterase family protein [Desulfolithobacter dissulfuricans]|nr:metallophosphoesterase [Desulfolithobacter dissulfuricans]